MRISTILATTGCPREQAPIAKQYEDHGLDIVWVAEAYGFDAPTMMGYLAAHTTRVQIGSAIMPIYSRTPALLAQTIAGLDHVSEGRAILGIGASGPQVVEGWHGVKYDQPLARTAAVVDIVRQALRREVVQYDGVYQLPLPAEKGTGLGKPLKLMLRPDRSSVPVYVAALGPKNVEQTAEIADGWLPLFYLPESAQEVWGPSLAKGAERRAPDLGPLEVVAGGVLAFTDDPEPALDMVRPNAALYIGGMGARGKNFYFELACSYGYEAAAVKIQDAYLAGRKDEAAALVPLSFLERTNLVGSKGFVRDRVQAYAESGATVLNAILMQPDPAAISTLRELCD
jgi:F420-dependent oxidoreductase-like protein